MLNSLYISSNVLLGYFPPLFILTSFAIENSSEMLQVHVGL